MAVKDLVTESWQPEGRMAVKGLVARRQDASQRSGYRVLAAGGQDGSQRSGCQKAGWQSKVWLALVCAILQHQLYISLEKLCTVMQ